MAGNSIGSKIGHKLLGWLDNLFKTISSPIQGYDVMDVKAKQDGDNFSSMFQFENKNSETGEVTKLTDKQGKEITDINNNKIDIYVLLRTTNAQTVLNPILNAINSMGDEDVNLEVKTNLLNILFGTYDERQDTGLTYYEDDNKKSGQGLLSYKFSTLEGIFSHSSNGFSLDGKNYSWGNIVEYLNYDLECETPGKDYGAVTGKNLDSCVTLIAEYLEMMGIVKNRGEVKIDSNILVVPILAKMQEFLGNYWNDAVKKYKITEIEKPVENPEENPDENPEETQEPTSEEQAAHDQLAEAYNPDGTENGDDGIVESKHIDVTLQRITGTSEFKMTAIKANYDYSEVLDDIDEIINQSEFIQALPEVPTSYAIDVDDDGFDIEPCEECIECDPCASLCEVFKAGIRAYRNLYIIHWMSYGNDMMKLHLLAEDMYEELIKEIDTIGELLVEKQGTVPQLDFPCDYVAVQNYDFQTGLDYIQPLINMYIDCIDFAYCNQDSDVQSTLDEWLRYWKKQLNYFVGRQEV